MSDNMINNNENEKTPKFSRNDYLSSSEPRWCAGCGAYAVFRSLTGMFAKLEIPREKIAVISGIGCSSRFPYYVETYGFHTLHGRAAPIAMGVKLTQPDLSVWVVTGDGDALSIGGNHFVHFMRKNPDIKMLLFNNQVYALTKGQASPTTPIGKKTYTTPFGSIDEPIKPISMGIACGATFVARVTDRDMPMINEILEAAEKHKGAAIIEVLLNCVIFNDGAFEPFTDKKVRDDNVVMLKHGEPLIFGKNRDKAITFDHQLKPKVVQVGKDIAEKDLPVFDMYNPNSAWSFALAEMTYPEFPLPLGIFRQTTKPSYDQLVKKQIQDVTAKEGSGDMQKLLEGAAMWTVDKDGKTTPVK